MPWNPLLRAALEAQMHGVLALADDRVRAAWERIRCEPVKWQCSPMGDQGGGFWVEDGFNRSA